MIKRTTQKVHKLMVCFASSTMHYFMKKYLSAAVANQLGKFTSILKLDDPQLVSSGPSTSMNCESK